MARVPAAAQTLGVLRLLARQPTPVPAATVVRELRLPRSTVYHLLDTMVAEGFVVHLPEERRYGLGVMAYELAWGYARHEPMQRLARVPLAALVDTTGHSGHFAVLRGTDVVYILEERAKGRPPLVTDVGVRLPAHLTATGKAMLALLPRREVRAMFGTRAALVTLTERGATGYADLTRRLTEVRGRGYATEDGEVTDGLSSVAVAVVDHAGRPVGAVALTFADQPDAGATVETLLPAVQQAAARIGRRLGGSAG